MTSQSDALERLLKQHKDERTETWNEHITARFVRLERQYQELAALRRSPPRNAARAVMAVWLREYAQVLRVEERWVDGPAKLDEAAAMLEAPLNDTGEHPDTIALRAWQQSFGTTQLSHARAAFEEYKARAERAEIAQVESSRSESAAQDTAKVPEFVPIDFKDWLQSLPTEDTKAIFRRVWDLYDGSAGDNGE